MTVQCPYTTCLTCGRKFVPTSLPQYVVRHHTVVGAVHKSPPCSWGLVTVSAQDVEEADAPWRAWLHRSWVMPQGRADFYGKLLALSGGPTAEITESRQIQLDWWQQGPAQLSDAEVIEVKEKLVALVEEWQKVLTGSEEKEELRMTNQEALEKIEWLLRKNGSLEAAMAWQAITLPGIALAEARIDRVPRDISDWPEGAVYGLLEQDICDTMEWWEPEYWLLAPGAWKARILQARGSRWHTGATRNQALAAAIIAALEGEEHESTT